MSNYRRVEFSEYKAAAAVMAEIFMNENITLYFTKCDNLTDEQARQATIDMYEYVLYAHLLKGEVYTIGENYEGLALWLPPGCDIYNWDMLRSGMWRLYYKLGPIGRHRFFDIFMPALHHNKTDILKEHDTDSWYLVYICTAPSARGKGYARKLIDPILEIADKEGKMCYLESSSTINTAIYKRFGFDSVKPLEFPVKEGEDPVLLSLMSRKPVSRDMPTKQAD